MTQATSISFKEKAALTLLSGAVVFCAIFYSLLLRQAVMNVVDRRADEQKMITLNSTIGDLESRYITLQNAIDRNRATTLGFHDVGETDMRFVSRAEVPTTVAIETGAFAR